MGHKRDRQTNVLISKSGSNFGALYDVWTMEEDTGMSGLERVWVGLVGVVWVTSRPCHHAAVYCTSTK
jgi:hypothetical protein